MRATQLFLSVALVSSCLAMAALGAQADEAAAVPEAAPPVAAAPAAPKAKRAQLEDLLSDSVQSFKEGQVEQAIHGLQRCVSLDKNFAACSRTLGIVYGKAGDTHRAAYYLKAYLKLAPKAADAERITDLVKEYES